MAVVRHEGGAGAAAAVRFGCAVWLWVWVMWVGAGSVLAQPLEAGVELPDCFVLVLWDHDEMEAPVGASDTMKAALRVLNDGRYKEAGPHIRLVRGLLANEPPTPSRHWLEAQLLYVEMNDNYVSDFEQFDVLMQAYAEGRVSDEPPLPEKKPGPVVAHLEAFLTRYPHAPQRAQVLHLLCQIFFREGLSAKALDAQQRLMQANPTDRQHQDVWFARALEHFSDQDWGLARRAFLEATRLDGPWTHMASMMVGWDFYRQKRCDLALPWLLRGTLSNGDFKMEAHRFVRLCTEDGVEPPF